MYRVRARLYGIPAPCVLVNALTRYGISIGGQESMCHVLRRLGGD
jgi:hypothetical protein